MAIPSRWRRSHAANRKVRRRAGHSAMIADFPNFRTPMAQYVYTMQRVGKVVPPKRQILKDISLSFFPGAKIGVLGLNGSGKSSLLKIMAGEDKNFDGEAVPMPNMTIGFLPQEPELDPDKTVRETVEEGLGAISEAKQKLDEIYAASAEPDADFDKLAADQAKYEAVIAAAGGDTEHQLEIAADALRLPPWDAQIQPLSGGEKRRVALCRLLLSKPDMLLLDEPTNHLDAESVEWLEQFLTKFPGTVIAVTHDRYFLDNAAEWILELDGDRLLIDDLSFTVPPGAIVGIIGPNGAGKSTLFRMITGKEKPGKGEVDIGKSVKLAVVDQSRDELEGDKTVFDFISHGSDVLNVGKFEMPSRAYLGRFNFKGTDQSKKVGNLSGGERGRLHLAATLIEGGNVLLLDEPSNDLDVETLRALEDALLEFAGSILVISHDRWFLDRIATHILAAEGESKWTFFNGNYQEYEADKKKRLGEEGAKPKRIRFKPLK